MKCLIGLLVCPESCCRRVSSLRPAALPSAAGHSSAPASPSETSTRYSILFEWALLYPNIFPLSDHYVGWYKCPLDKNIFFFLKAMNIKVIKISLGWKQRGREQRHRRLHPDPVPPPASLLQPVDRLRRCAVVGAYFGVPGPALAGHPPAALLLPANLT